MAKLSDLLAQKAALDQQIEQVRRDEREAAIAQIRALMSEHGLSVADLGSRASKPSRPQAAGAKVAPKYRNKATGETWSGRGLQPRWLKAALEGGKKLSDFAV